MLKAYFQSNDRKVRSKIYYGVKDFLTYRQIQYVIDPNAVYRSGLLSIPTIMYIEGFPEPCNFFNVDNLPEQQNLFNTNNVALILKKLFRINSFEEIMLILMAVLIIGLIVLGIMLGNITTQLEEILPYVAQ